MKPCMKPRGIYSIIILGAALAVIACSGGGDGGGGSGGNGPPLGTSGTVPTSGGRVTTALADVTVPANAALAPVTVTITPVDPPAGLPAGLTAVVRLPMSQSLTRI